MMTRPGITISSAATITCILLLSMTALIDQGIAAPAKTYRVVLDAPGMPPTPPEPEQPTKPTQPPPPMAPPVSTRDTTGVTEWPRPTVIAPPGSRGPDLPDNALSGTLDVQRFDDGPAIEVMPVQPIYPGKMLARGLEGSVVVTFSVNPAGRVMNATVVSSTHRGFEKAALNAIERFRYQPRMIDGAAVATHNLQKQFTFHVER
ncbi:MAG: TonB family protein [Pseudomonadota bacterium]